jgi:invasion protein IalB
MKKTYAIAALAAFAAGAGLTGSASAQDATGKAPASATPAHHEMAMQNDSANMSGMHEMPATVTNVDHKTGIVDVESMNMKLKVHFPANTVAELKSGDKITLHLGYSKQG